MPNKPEAGQLYCEIAEELSGELTLDDLDPRAVKKAQAWAKQNHRKWPPKPQTSGWQMQVWSL